MDKTSSLFICLFLLYPHPLADRALHVVCNLVTLNGAHHWSVISFILESEANKINKAKIGFSTKKDGLLET